MYTSMWSYPWDFVDCCVEPVLDEMQSVGLNDVSLITSYHAGRFLQVRSPVRKSYFPEDGVLYYPASMERFKHLRIQPKIGQFQMEHPNFFSKLINEAEARKMTVSGWTVCLHNTRLGYEYPDACVHNAFGDTVYYNQCPANDDVRQYIVALLRDIDRTLPFKSIQLESMNFMGFAHEYHHEKDGLGLTPYEDFLLSLCFCESCMRKGKAAGIDMDSVRAWVRGQVHACLNSDRHAMSSHGLLQQGLAFFSETPEVLAFLRWRSNIITSLMQEVRGSGFRSELYFLSLLTNRDSWLYGVNLADISNHCDGIVICSYDCSAEQAVQDIQLSRKEFNPQTKIITGMRAFYPEYASESSFVQKVKSVLDASRDGFIFYNYGLIPKRQLDWVRQATAVINA